MRAVVLPGIGHLDVPQQLTGQAVQRNQVCVVGLEEHAIAQHGDTAIQAGRRVVDKARRTRPAVVPDLATCARVEGPDFVGCRHVHETVDDDGRDLQRALPLTRDGERPLRRKARDVRRRDLVERAVTIAAEETVVRGPLAGLRLRNVGERHAGAQRGVGARDRRRTRRSRSAAWLFEIEWKRPSAPWTPRSNSVS